MMERIFPVICSLTRLIVCFFVSVNLSCSKEVSPFLKKVCSDQRRNSYYIVVQINNDDYVVSNSYFNYILTKEGILGDDEYISVVENNIVNGINFVLDNKVMEEYHLRNNKYISVAEISIYAWAGKEEFIRHYFTDNHTLKDPYQKYETAIIYQLFSWEIPCWNDCETGTLMIDYNDD